MDRRELMLVLACTAAVLIAAAACFGVFLADVLGMLPA